MKIDFRCIRFQNLFPTEVEATEILNILNYLQKANKPFPTEVELLASYVAGALVSLVPENRVSAEIVQRLTQSFECSLTLDGNQHADGQSDKSKHLCDYTCKLLLFIFKPTN